MAAGIEATTICHKKLFGYGQEVSATTAVFFLKPLIIIFQIISKADEFNTIKIINNIIGIK